MTAAPPPTSTAPRVKARGGFLRAVIVLVSGSAIAHGLTAAALPILSRLYSPTDFGLLAVFSSALSIIAVAACLRYDVAVPLPDEESDGLHLVVLALLCALAVTMLLAIPVALAPDWIAARLGQSSLAPHLWLLPVGVLLSGAYSALQFWFVRQTRFTLLSRTRIAQSGSSAGAQIGLGLLAAGPLGLLVGYVMNTGVACLTLGAQLLRSAPRVTVARLKLLAREYSRFPKYSALESIANSAAIQLPIIMIAALAVPAEAGYLMMAMYVMQAPMSLIGGAISQVYLSRAPEEHRNGRLGSFTAEILGGLFKAGTGPLLATGILSPLLFGLIFGTDWVRAGWLVTWMTPWFLMQFLAVPIAMALHVAGHQRAALRLQVFGLILRVLAVWTAAHLSKDLISETYAVSGAVFYLLYLLLILRSAKASRGEVMCGLRRGLRMTMFWIGAAGLVLGIISFVRGGFGS